MTPAELAKKIRVSVETVYNHANKLGIERTAHGGLRLLMLDEAAADRISESVRESMEARRQIDVAKARKMRAGGATYQKIADCFDVSRQAVCAALREDE